MANNEALLRACSPEISHGGDGNRRLSFSDSEADPAAGDTKTREPPASTPQQRGPVAPDIKTTAASVVGSVTSATGVDVNRFVNGQHITVAREAASKQKEASIAYFAKQEQEPAVVKMDHRHIDMHSVPKNAKWFEEMKEFGERRLDGLDYYVAPHFRWIHLPSNTPDWIKVRLVPHRQ